MADIDKSTGTPRTVTLGDVFGKIELAPAQVGELLRGFAYSHLGGAHDNMARVLLQHANDIADPATYGNAPQDTPNNPQALWGTPGVSSPPTTASGVPIGTAATTPVPASGAAQGQSALPATGTANEPSWMADARAAGWNPDQPPAEPSWMADARAAGWRNRDDEKTPESTATFAVRSPARHFDEARGQWVDNATGQPVDVGGASTSTPPQPRAPEQ